MTTEEQVIADEAAFIDLPRIAEEAGIVVSKTKTMLSDPRYQDERRKLEVTWLPQERFRAFASVRPGVPQVDRIGISYGVARELHRDAHVLPLFCESHFNSDQYAEVFAALSYGDGVRRVLPPELSAADATIRIRNSTLAWLYLHEQSHLFQNHGEIGRKLGASWARNELMIDETRDEDSAPPTGLSAALSHAFELAADHEALNNVLGLMLKVNGNSIPAHSLWTLVAGLTCMFQRFYGVVDRPEAEEVIGSHPDPSFRMRVLLREMTLIMMNSQVRKYAPWIEELADLEAVTDHAVITATMYCHIRYRKGHPVSAFLPGVQAYSEVPLGYQQAVFDAWNTARPLVLNDYRGWGEQCVLDLKTIGHLS